MCVYLISIFDLRTKHEYILFYDVYNSQRCIFVGRDLNFAFKSCSIYRVYLSLFCVCVIHSSLVHGGKKMIVIIYGNLFQQVINYRHDLIMLKMAFLFYTTTVFLIIHRVLRCIIIIIIIITTTTQFY